MNLGFRSSLIALSVSLLLCTGCTGLSRNVIERLESMEEQSSGSSDDMKADGEGNDQSEGTDLYLPASGKEWDENRAGNGQNGPGWEADVTGNCKEIDEDGDIILSFGTDSLAEKGYEAGDVVKITIDEIPVTVPYVQKKSDVDEGMSALYEKEGELLLGTRRGSFAGENNIAVFDKDENSWIISGGRDISDISLEICLREKGGYKDGYEARRLVKDQLVRSMDRAEYESDEVFANFRSLKGGGIKEGLVFRCSSPVNNELNRAKYSDKLISENKINTVVNMADSAGKIERLMDEGGSHSPYYRKLFSSGRVIPLDMGMDFNSDENLGKIAEGIRFIIENDGPYLVHCKEGKDRTGLLSIILEAYMGASFEEMRDDYMKSYENYFFIKPDSPEYTTIQNGIFLDLLSMATGLERWEIKGEMLSAGAGTEEARELIGSSDYSKGAEEFLHSLGLSDEECEALKKKLSDE